MNIERRQRFSGQGRTYVRSSAKIPINFDLSSLDLMCSYILSENRNIKKSQYFNLRNLIEMLDIDKYLVITILSKCTFLTIIPYIYTNSY